MASVPWVLAPLARFMMPVASTCSVPVPDSATPTFRVPAEARTRPLLTNAESVKLMVPPLTLAFTVPLLMSVWVPPMLI